MQQDHVWLPDVKSPESNSLLCVFLQVDVHACLGGWSAVSGHDTVMSVRAYRVTDSYIDAHSLSLGYK